MECGTVISAGLRRERGFTRVELATGVAGECALVTCDAGLAIVPGTNWRFVLIDGMARGQLCPPGLFASKRQ
jgi:hypothetical protein